MKMNNMKGKSGPLSNLVLSALLLAAIIVGDHAANGLVAKFKPANTRPPSDERSSIQQKGDVAPSIPPVKQSNASSNQLVELQGCIEDFEDKLFDLLSVLQNGTENGNGATNGNTAASRRKRQVATLDGRLTFKPMAALTGGVDLVQLLQALGPLLASGTQLSDLLSRFTGTISNGLMANGLMANLTGSMSGNGNGPSFLDLFNLNNNNINGLARLFGLLNNNSTNNNQGLNLLNLFNNNRVGGNTVGDSKP